MTLSLLQIVQNAQAELGLPQAASVIGNTDPTTMHMLALANRVLDDLRRMHPIGWANMQNEYEIVVQQPITATANITLNSNVMSSISASVTVSVALQAFNWQISANSTPVAARILSVDGGGQVTMTMEATGTVNGASIVFAKDTYPMPVDYDWTQNRTHWDRTNRWALIGHDSPQIDQWHRSGIVATGPRRHFRKLGSQANQFRVWPAPAEVATPLQLVFEYLSINAVQTASSNTCIFVGSITGNVLKVISITSGFLGMGQSLSGASVVPGTVINGLLSANTFQVNIPQSLGSTNMAATGTAYTQYFNTDTDTPLLDDQAMVTGIKWQFFATKGFNVSMMRGDWIDYVEKLIARDVPSETLPIVRTYDPLLMTSYSVQDGFFPAGTSTVSGS